MTMATLEAKDFLDPGGLILESASRLANVIVARLNSGVDVEISLAGIKGIPSSYYNVILQRLAEILGAENIERRVRFRFDSEPQREVFERSLSAVTKSVV